VNGSGTACGLVSITTARCDGEGRGSQSTRAAQPTVTRTARRVVGHHRRPNAASTRRPGSAESPDEAGPILQRYVRLAPSARAYFQVVKDSPVEAFTAEADRHPVFELTRAGADRQPGHPGH
jgi:hypothetical protein